MSGKKRSGLQVVPGGVAAPPPEPKRPRPSGPLTKSQRVTIEGAIAVHEAIVDALELAEASYSAPTPQLALERARALAGRLGEDPAHLRRVLAALAVEAVWTMPRQDERPRTDREVHRMQVLFQAWMWDRRRVAMQAIRHGRDLLRRQR